MALNLLLADQLPEQIRKRRGYAPAATAGLLLLGLDVLIVGLVGVFIHFGPFAPADVSNPELLLSFGLGLLAFPISKLIFNLYPGHGLSRAQRLQRVVIAVAIAAMTMIALESTTNSLLTPNSMQQRLHVVEGAIILGLLLTLSDPIGRSLLLRMGRWSEPVFIFGAGGAGGEVVRQLRLYPHLGYTPVCIIDDGSVYIPDDEQGVPVIRSKELAHHTEALRLSTTALVVEEAVERSLILRLYTSGVFQRILLVPQCHDLISLKSQIRRVGGMVAIEVSSDRPSLLAARGKRAVDIVASALVILLSLPLLAALWILVRADSQGPALFSQPRWAGGNETFTVLKFRTMHLDGDQRLRRYFLTHPLAEREYAKYHKLDDDPRITVAGRFLRSTSLDELPQFINVLRGDMSLVGPRPYTLGELSKLGPARAIISVVKPGVTGFWQVSGRNRRTFRERIEMDCYYVRNLSIWLDIWVLYRTMVGVITREGK